MKNIFTFLGGLSLGLLIGGALGLLFAPKAGKLTQDELTLGYKQFEERLQNDVTDLEKNFEALQYTERDYIPMTRDR
jgi:gas vesicle protein